MLVLCWQVWRWRGRRTRRGVGGGVLGVLDEQVKDGVSKVCRGVENPSVFYMRDFEGL